ncbi:unnamed protein product [Scytosiphon promiscuus]
MSRDAHVVGSRERRFHTPLFRRFGFPRATRHPRSCPPFPPSLARKKLTCLCRRHYGWRCAWWFTRKFLRPDCMFSQQSFCSQPRGCFFEKTVATSHLEQSGS